MKKDTVWLVVAIVLLLGVIGGLIWLFGGFGGGDTGVVEDGGQDQVTEAELSQEEESPTEEPEEESNPNIPDEEQDEGLGDAEVDSTVTYSTSAQNVGEDTEELFTLSSVDVTKGEEVVEILYVFKGDELTEDSSIPVSATNKSSLGMMEIVIKNVKSDNTGMNYDESIEISREGLTRLTKVVSGESNTLKYTLGFVDAPDFYLYDPEVKDGELVVKFSVKYPGGEVPTEDYGSSEFTTEDISVESSTADNGVRISGYSYSVTGGVLRYIFKTSSNTGSPIPSFKGSIADGTLTVTFPSLSTDVIYSSSSGGEISLPGGIILNISRSGNESVYEFVGVGEQYKLYGVTSPNQVVLEVQL
jgi:hypothetical protein